MVRNPPGLGSIRGELFAGALTPRCGWSMAIEEERLYIAATRAPMISSI